MRLSECLNSSDIDTLRKIAEAYEFTCSKSSKNALMQEIMAHFNNRKFLAAALDDIKEQAYREAVAQLMLDNRREFSREEVLAMMRRAAELREGQLGDGSEKEFLQRLLGSGWLFRLNSKGGRQFYFIPDDLRKMIRDHLAEGFKSRVRVAQQPPIVYRDENCAMARDCAVFLNHAAKQELRITKDGTLMKRKQQEIFSLLEIQEEVLQNVQWRFGFGRRFHDYPDRFALIYDYCYNRGLILEGQSGQLEVTAKAEEWCRQPEKERAEDLFRYWRLLYRRPIPKLKLCIATLSAAAKNDWVHASSMNELLAPYVTDYYSEKAPALMEQRIYNMLVHLGLLAYGQLADGTAVLKVTPLGRELLLQEEGAEDEPEEAEAVRGEPYVPLILQPNFDLLVPQDGYERIAWELEEVTELIRVDTMRIHRLTKASVTRAFDLGWTGETVLDFLCEETGDMVPGNVERMIEQWESEFRPVTLSRGVVVDCKEASIAADLKSMPGIAPHLRLQLTAHSFLIGEGGVPALQEGLRKMGYQAEIIS